MRKPPTELNRCKTATVPNSPPLHCRTQRGYRFRQISSIKFTVPFGWLPPPGMDSGYPGHNITPAQKLQLSPSEAPWWPFNFNPKHSSRTAYNTAAQPDLQVGMQQDPLEISRGLKLGGICATDGPLRSPVGKL